MTTLSNFSIGFLIIGLFGHIVVLCLLAAGLATLSIWECHD